MTRVLRYAIAFVLAIPLLAAAFVLGTARGISIALRWLSDTLYELVVEPIAHWIDLNVL